MESKWKRTLARSQHKQLRNGRPKGAQNVTREIGGMEENGVIVSKRNDALRVVAS